MAWPAVKDGIPYRSPFSWVPLLKILVARTTWPSSQGYALKKFARWSGLHRVTILLSPPYFPRNNGAVEADIGSLKSRAHLEAAPHGHPCEWNCDDLEAARLQANEQAKPWGFKEESPDILWLERQPIDTALRQQFKQSVQEINAELRQEKGQQMLSTGDLPDGGSGNPSGIVPSVPEEERIVPMLGQNSQWNPFTSRNNVVEGNNLVWERPMKLVTVADKLPRGRRLQ